MRFYDVPTGLAALDRDRLYAEFWLHQDDLIEEDRHRALKCAEVLVPDRVAPELIQGAYVANTTARNAVRNAVQSLTRALPLTIKSAMFFF